MGDSANTDSICQAKGEPGQAPVPTPTLETNKPQSILFYITTELKPEIVLNYMFPQNVLIMQIFLVGKYHGKICTFYAMQVIKNSGHVGLHCVT